MNADETLQFLKRYYASWGTLDPENVVGFFTADAVFEDLAFQARFEGKDGIRGFAQLTYGGAPDFCVKPKTFAIGEGRAGVEWVMSGTHRGDLPGLPSTGQPFEIRASSMVRFEENLIAHIVDYWDLDTFRQSVGLLPA